MGIVMWIVFGFVAGVLAKMLMPGADRGGIVVTILLGIAGAVLGGLLATSVGWGTVNTFDVRSLSIATGGALLVLMVFRLVAKRTLT